MTLSLQLNNLSLSSINYFYLIEINFLALSPSRSSVIMSRSRSAVSKKQFKLDKMVELRSSDNNDHEKKERCSFFSIPPPSLENIYKQITTTQKKTIEEEKKVKEGLTTQMCNSMCNGYRFVVNYGVFEANFEWLPNEVKFMKERKARLELSISFEI